MKMFLKIMRVMVKLLLLAYVFVVNIFLLTFFYLALKDIVTTFFPSFLPALISRYALAGHLVANLPFYLVSLYALFCLSPLYVWYLRGKEGFRPLYQKERRRVDRLLRELGLDRKLKIYINSDPEENAVTFGFHTVGITKGLWSAASDEELKGVICHEVGHISHYDFVYGTLLYSLEVFGRRALFGIFVIPVSVVSVFLFFLPGLVELIRSIWWLIYRLVDRVIYGLSRFAYVNINKYGEYRCDTYAVKYDCGYGLLSFLRKQTVKERHTDRPSFTEYMMSTHPALHKRVARLEKLV